MTEVTEDVYTILKFIDVKSSGRIYLGEKLWSRIDDDSMDEFELALDRFEVGFKRVYLFSEDWEVMADLAFAKEWSRQSLSALLTEVEQRGVEVIVHRESPVSDVLDGTSSITAAR